MKPDSRGRWKALWNYLRREHGVGVFAYLMWWALDREESCAESDAFDERYGVDTSDELTPAELQIPEEASSHALLYWPTRCSALRSQIAQLDQTLISKSTFIDLGSGKGRALFVGADFPFKQLLGVEISPVLHAIAGRNLSVWQRSRGADQRIHLVLQDAREFAFPDAPLVLYAYHPFDEMVAAQVLSRLASDLVKRPRPVALLYRSPVRMKTGWPDSLLAADGHLHHYHAETEQTRFFKAVHTIWVNRLWSGKP